MGLTDKIGIAILCAFVLFSVVRLFAAPLKLAAKVLLNTALGFLALFLLGLTDYLCRRNGVKPDSKFDACRNARLDRAVYALRTLEENDDACAFEEARCYTENNAIPELTRFNIYMTEDDIRQMA